MVLAGRLAEIGAYLFFGRDSKTLSQKTSLNSGDRYRLGPEKSAVEIKDEQAAIRHITPN